jgi:hypothetical protein
MKMHGVEHIKVTGAFFLSKNEELHLLQDNPIACALILFVSLFHLSRYLTFLYETTPVTQQSVS